MRPYYDETALCADGYHDSCPGKWSGIVWASWPPKHGSGACSCACHAPAFQASLLLGSTP